MREIKELLNLFQKTWTEAEAFRIRQSIEASGHSANWEECVRTARSRAQGLFQPLVHALENGTPLQILRINLRGRLEASRK